MNDLLIVDLMESGAGEMIDAALRLPQEPSSGSSSNVVYFRRHSPKKRTMSTAVAATLLR